MLVWQQYAINSAFPSLHKPRSQAEWQKSVADGVRKMSMRMSVGESGYPTLAFWWIAPGGVLEKLVIAAGGVRPSYLGPPQSVRGQP